MKNQSEEQRKLAIEGVFKAVEECTGHSKRRVLERNRKESVADARRLVAYYLYRKTDVSTSEIGRILNRDHATVMYLRKTVRPLSKVDKGFSSLMEKVDQALSQFDTIRNR